MLYFLFFANSWNISFIRKRDSLQNIQKRMVKALLLIDAQNDFTQGGSLAVKGSTQIYSYLNKLKQSEEFSAVILSQDYHLPGHVSFAISHNKQPFTAITINGKVQQLWPVHCIQGTNGVEFYPLLNTNGSEIIIRKGTRIDKDSYSAFQFFDGHCELDKLLKDKGIDEVVVAGLAFDFCVGSTALDAVELGFKASIIMQATKSVSRQTHTIMQSRLKQTGVKMLSFHDVYTQKAQHQ